MKKGLGFKLLILFTLAAIVVFWILALAMPESSFAKYWQPAYITAALTGVVGVIFLVSAFRGKHVIAKKLNITLACCFFVACALSLGLGVAKLDNKFTLPIVAAVVVGCLILSLLSTGGKKWDTCDNEKVGYKNYRERKEEENRKLDK